METTFFLKSLSLFHCVPLYVCRLCINFKDLCARLLGMAALRILLLTFISRFVIDFLSIRKVIIFFAIASDDRHPLRSTVGINPSFIMSMVDFTCSILEKETRNC